MPLAQAAFLLKWLTYAVSPRKLSYLCVENVNVACVDIALKLKGMGHPVLLTGLDAPFVLHNCAQGKGMCSHTFLHDVCNISMCSYSHHDLYADMWVTLLCWKRLTYIGQVHFPWHLGLFLAICQLFILTMHIFCDALFEYKYNAKMHSDKVNCFPSSFVLSVS